MMTAKFPWCRRHVWVAVVLVGFVAVASCGGEDTAVHTTRDATTTSTTTTTESPSSSTVAPPVSPPTSTPAAPPPGSSTDVYGKVTAGPTCPVERVEQPCEPRPVDTDVQAQTAAGDVVAITHTDSTGAYNLSLAPGSYTLIAVTATAAALPRCQPTPVIVTPGTAAQANIDCDTGIR